MAITKRQRNLLENSINFQEKAVDDFQEDIPKIQKSMFREVLLLIKDLEVGKDGKIKNTVANRRKVQRFQKIRNKILTPKYQRDVEKFLEDFDTTKEKTDKYLNSLDG